MQRKHIIFKDKSKLELFHLYILLWINYMHETSDPLITQFQNSEPKSSYCKSSKDFWLISEDLFEVVSIKDEEIRVVYFPNP